MPSGVIISRTVTPRREEDEAEHPMEAFVASGVRALVDMQTELDRLGRESLVEWELNGTPPTVWTYSRCRLSFPVAFAARPRTHAVGSTRLEIAPRTEARGQLTLTFRYEPKPVDED